MVSVPGPTLLNLQHIVGSSVHNITWVFGARGFGQIIASILFGFIVKDRWRSATFGINFVVAGIAFGFVPWSRSLAEIIVVFIVNGFGVGFVIASK
jgi:predicted MFS family arabinose efflux permease